MFKSIKLQSEHQCFTDFGEGFENHRCKRQEPLKHFPSSPSLSFPGLLEPDFQMSLLMTWKLFTMLIWGEVLSICFCRETITVSPPPTHWGREHILLHQATSSARGPPSKKGVPKIEPAQTSIIAISSVTAVALSSEVMGRMKKEMIVQITGIHKISFVSLWRTCREERLDVRKKKHESNRERKKVWKMNSPNYFMRLFNFGVCIWQFAQNCILLRD